MDSIKKQTIKSAKWSAIEKLGLEVIQFVLGIIMARLLTPQDYGAVGMLAIFIAISTTFIDGGFSNALIRKKNVDEKDYSTIFYFNLLIAIICYIILFVCAPFIANFFHIEILSSILRIQSLTLIINSLMVVQVAQLKTKLNFKALAKRNLTSSILSGICGVTLAYLGCGVWALVGQNLIHACINLLLIIYFCRWKPTEKFSVESFKELGAYGSKLLASSLLNQIYQNLTSFIIGKFYTASDLGFYNRGMHIAKLPIQTYNGILGQVIFPILSKIQEDDERLSYIYRKYIRMTSILIFIVVGLMIALARPLVLLLLTDKWEPAIIYLQIYSLTMMFAHISSINLDLLKVKGRSDLYLRLEIIKKTISVLMLLVAAHFSVIAICIAAALYGQIAIIINTYYTGKLINVGYLTQVKDFLPYLGCSIVACTPAFILTLTSLPYIITLVIGFIVSISIYWALLRKDTNMQEIVSLIISKFRLNK